MNLSLIPTPLLLPARTLAGAGSLAQLPKESAAFGPAGVVVHGAALGAPGRWEALHGAFARPDAVCAFRHGGGEPTLDDVERLRAALREARPDWVAAVGGGSVIDLAKAAAGLLDAPLPVADYQAGAPIPPARLPLLAVPSTAGTGSEATVVSVLTDTRKNLKLSIRHPSFMPRVVILDPELLRACPRATLAAAGLDAFTQAFESYTSRHATPLTRALSELALVRIAAALPTVVDGNLALAGDLLEGSYLAGLALSHARLGVVHGLAHPLGARWHAAHGLVCAVCLPACLRFNAPVIGDDLAQLARLLGRDLPGLVDEWLQRFQLVSPFRGAVANDRAAIIAETLASGSTAANPRPVTAADVDALLEDLFRG